MSKFIAALKHLPRFVIASIAAVTVAVLCLYYPIGMLVVHKVDDDPDFKAAQFEMQGGSHAVSITVALIDREINRYAWVSNDPFFYPGSMLDRMPAFQRGIISALSRFSISLSDQIGRARGSSQADADLLRAVGLLNYSPYVWVFDFSTSVLPTASSEAQYRAAMSALQSYNLRLSQGKAVFEKRSDNLLETLDRFAADLGAASADIDEHIRAKAGTFIDTGADVQFYTVKGKMYGYYLVLRELEKDYEPLIKERQLGLAWGQMLASLREGAELSNFFIFNASPDSQFFPNHLAAQGFYLMRARTQLREITNILLK